MGDVPTARKAHTGEAINLPYEGGLMLKIVGYPDRYSVPQGGEIRFMVSLEEGELAARLVRVVNGDCNPDGPGLKFREIAHPANKTYRGERQTIDAGSYMVAPSVPPSKDLHSPPGSGRPCRSADFRSSRRKGRSGSASITAR